MDASQDPDLAIAPVDGDFEALDVEGDRPRRPRAVACAFERRPRGDRGLRQFVEGDDTRADHDMVGAKPASLSIVAKMSGGEIEDGFGERR